MAKKEPQVYRKYMYHDDCPAGKIFMSDQVEELEKKGWRQRPNQIKIPAKEDEVPEELAKRFTLEDHKGLLEKAGFIVMTQEQMTSQANRMADSINNIRADELKLSDLPDETIRDEVRRRGMDVAINHPTPHELSVENAAAQLNVEDPDADNVGADLVKKAGGDPAGAETLQASDTNGLVAGDANEPNKEDPDGFNEPTKDPLEVLENVFNEDPDSLGTEDLIKLGNDRLGLKLKRTQKDSTMVTKINAALKGK